MEIEDEEFGCLGIPTEAQIWKQQADLVQAEYEQVATDLRQARANILKLVDIHAVTPRERDQALNLLASYKRDLSAAHVELSALGNRMRGMQMAERQSARQIQAGCHLQSFYVPKVQKHVCPTGRIL